MEEKKEKKKKVFGKITDEEFERVKRLVDVPRTKSSMRPQEEYDITRDFIRRVATGVADMNPLYLDEQYAKESWFGTRICPPGIIASMEKANGATDGFPGCHAIWRESTMEWDEPIYLGETIKATTSLRNVEFIPSKFAGGRAAKQDHETVVINQDEVVKGRYKASWHRFERSGAKKASKYEGRELAQYTKEDIQAIKEEYKQEKRRGASLLYWEDVTVGEELPTLLKGPTTVASKFAFEAMFGGGGWVVGHHLAFELNERHRGLAFINEQGIPEPPVTIHWSNERSQKILGLPGAYDAGYERINWVIQQIMNWMGDEGGLRRLTVRFPNFALLGDLTRCYAKVTAKREEYDAGVVDLEIWTEVQTGDTTTKGEAQVVLPRKNMMGA